MTDSQVGVLQLLLDQSAVIVVFIVQMVVAYRIAIKALDLMKDWLTQRAARDEQLLKFLLDLCQKRD
jgi:hypothetical protein